MLSIMDSANKQGNESNIHSVEFMIRSNDELVHKKNVLLTKPRALSKAIAEVLIVDVRNIEVYQLIASGEGIKVGFSVYSSTFQMETLYKNELKLAYLISDHWKVKQFTKIKDLRPVNMCTSNQLTKQETQSPHLAVPSSSHHGMHAKTMSDITLIPLTDMRMSSLIKVKSMDPELMELQNTCTHEHDLEELTTKYNNQDVDTNISWTEQANKINKLLAERRRLILSKDLNKLSVIIDDETKEQLNEIWDETDCEFTNRRLETMERTFDVKLFTPQTAGTGMASPSVSVYDSLHSRVQSTIQENLNVFEMVNPSKKYTIVIQSADSLGFTLKADEHGYNTKVTECATAQVKSMETKGIKLGMIISDINKQSVLGLPYHAVQKRLDDGMYPLKLSFMDADNVSIRFEMVLNAASLIYGALKNGFDEANIFAFLDAEGMSKLEIRTAVGLQCEYSDILKRDNDENELFALFIESQYAGKEKIKKAAEKSTFTPTRYRVHSVSESDSVDQRMDAMVQNIEQSRKKNAKAMDKISNQVTKLFSSNSNESVKQLQISLSPSTNLM